MAFWQKIFGADRTEDSIEQIKQNLEIGNAVMLDVRGQDERNSIRLKGSIFVPISEIKALAADAAELKSIPKDKIVYCH